MNIPPAITLYSFRVRTPPKMNWRVARYKMTLEHAIAAYGEGNYEMVPGTEEVREPIVGNLRGSR